MSTIKHYFRFILLVIFQSCLTLCLTAQTFGNYLIKDLSTAEWEFSEFNVGNWLKANVPGTVHTDLLYNKKIKDPYYRDNENKLQWIGEKNWEYKTSFNIDKQLFDKDKIDLVFEGLDTYADVFLNGTKILHANNMFRRWEIDAKTYLRIGYNELRVVFYSSVKINSEMNEKSPYKYSDTYVFTRKAAYQYGWDWGPVFITSGIWKPVYVRAWNKLRLNDVHVIQKSVSAQKALLTASCNVTSLLQQKAEVNVFCVELNKSFTRKVDLKPGVNTFEIDININSPKLWWSRGLGDPNLYTFKAEVIAEGNTKSNILKVSTGIRTVKVVQKPDSLGKSFYVELNGVPVFMKGADYIPLDMFPPRATDSLYRFTIKQAVMANMNMLRVWGGGFYENDIFYDLCDKNGILVWQDFMFACAMYPGTADFLENVKAEATENIIRLRNHPCIALWCGNNENYIGWKDWAWSKPYSKADSAQLWHDYEKLYEHLLPELVEKYDSGKFYWPSSPKYGWGYPVNTDGDVHYWGIWHDEEPFECFDKNENIGRFMSEYGFQGMPEMKSIKEFTLPEDRNIKTEVMKLHQKHRVGFPVIDKYMGWYYKWPKDFESYVYVSQLVQSKGIGLAIETHRRSMPHCMGTLYWQLNDLYPVTSWSSIDMYGRWKALHYRIKELYQDYMVTVHREGNMLRVYVVSDKLKDTPLQLEVKMTDFNGKEHFKKNLNVMVKANTSKPYYEIHIDSLLGAKRKPKWMLESKHVVRVKLMENTNTLTENLFYFTEPKDLLLSKPQITLKELRRENDEYILELSTNKLAKNVFLTLDETDVFFSNNYFDLLPGDNYIIRCKSNKTITDLDKKIQVRSLVDTYYSE